MQLQHLFTFSRLKNRLLKYDDATDITACCSGLGSGYFAILKEYPLTNNNKQSNLPRQKKRKDIK